MKKGEGEKLLLTNFTGKQAIEKGLADSIGTFE